MITLEIDDSTIYATAYRGDKPVATVQRHRSDDRSGIVWSGYDRTGNCIFASMFNLGAAAMVRRIELAGRHFDLQEGERKSVLKHLIEGGDLSRYGLFNAITRTAEDLADYDRATDFERMGGKVIELAANEWQRIAEAA